MSRRTNLYRDRKGKDVTETTEAVAGRHRSAVGKKSGKCCSLPMKRDKARRLAIALHHGSK